MKVETLVAIRGDGAKCLFCGATTTLTIDHIVPKSKGGKNILTNFIILCSSCNSLKQDYTIEELALKLEKILKKIKEWKNYEKNLFE